MRSHVLLTSSGIAFNEDEGEQKVKFLKWEEIPAEPETSYKSRKCQFKNICFTVVNDEKYESNYDFKIRARRFGSICKELRYNAMIKNPHIYVPINFSYLKDIISPFDEILYSTICHMKRHYSIGNKHYWEKWDGHVLITNSFIYLTRTDGRFWVYNVDAFNKIHPQSAKLSTATWKIKLIPIRHKNYESEEVFNFRSNHFGPFLEHLCRKIPEYNWKMQQLISDKDLLSKRITEIGFDNFAKDLNIYFHRTSLKTDKGWIRQKQNILQNTWDAIPENLRQSKYEFFKSLKEGVSGYYLKKGEGLILPNPPYTLYTKEEQKAQNLHHKGVKLSKKGKYEKALNLFEESLKLNPYEAEVKNSRNEALKALGRNVEID